MNFKCLHIEFYKTWIVTCLLFISCICYAQNSIKNPNEIKVIARVVDGKVLLRWAPTTPSAWIRSNTYGYSIEKYTVQRNGVLLDPPIKTILTKNTLLPEPLASWEQAVKDNDHAAILAQALYGETFSVEQMQGGFAQIINKAKAVEQRFSFALFAADMNFNIAKKAALGYEDTDIQNGEEYLYRIIPQVPEALLKITPGFISVKTKTSVPLPAPIDLYAVPDDKNILLTWEYQLFKSVFTSYHVERSENGTDFQRLGNTPLVNLNDKPEAPAKRMFYVDTVQNNKKYYYRVLGISPFGELSPSSKVVTATANKKLGAVPFIHRHDFDAKGGVKLTWDFKKEAEIQITSFELERSDNDDGPYTILQKGIPAQSRTTTIDTVEPSNYFKITAVGKNNQRTTSFPAFVQTIDSIPPVAPVGLEGTVDSLGVVQLKWSANTEQDILGYRVFRGNIEKEEFSQITVAPVTTATFVDTVQLKSLNSKVFYKIVAVDERFNMSDYSKLLALVKPDVIPPSSPLFSKYKVTSKGIHLHWINSSSDDVATHQLFRQNVKEAEKGWLLIFQTDTITSYLDTAVKGGIKYRYAIFAKDQSGLQSLPSTPLSATSQNKSNTIQIKGFTAIADRINKRISLSWRMPAADIKEVLIYKSKKGALPVLWKQIPKAITKITDTAISPNNVYVYQLKVVTKAGNHSQMAVKEITY